MTDDLFPAILSALRGVKGPDASGNYSARCPFHDDKHASLSLHPERGFRCHAESCGRRGTVRALAEHLGLETPRRRDGREVVATYPYRDEKGRLLYEVVRFRPKDFRQRRPDGKGGYVWNLEGVRRVLYRLPELLAADPSKPVFVPEGEKDVEALRSRGLVATCNVMGAGKWQPEYAEHLKGRHVVVLPDNDQPGRDHAARVVASLRGVAASVRLIELPGLPEKGDVSDWFAQGHSADELLELVRQTAPVYEDKPRFVLRSAEEIEALPRPRWLIENHIVAGSHAVLYGPSGSGKSFIALDWALSVATGKGWMGYETMPGPVVYVAAEGSAGLGDRLRAWKAVYGRETAGRVHFLTEPVNLMSTDDVKEFIRTLRLLPSPPVLVVVDTLARCMVGGDENSARDVGLANAGVDRIRHETGAAVLIVHHSGKQGTQERGSSALRAAADTMIELTDDEGAITLSCTKQKDAEPFPALPLRLQAVELDEERRSCVVRFDTEDDRRRDLERAAFTASQKKILDAIRVLDIGEGASLKDIMRVVALPDRTFYDARRALLDAGYIVKDGKRYRLTNKGSEAVRFTADTAVAVRSQFRTAVTAECGAPYRGPHRRSAEPALQAALRNGTAEPGIAVNLPPSERSELAPDDDDELPWPPEDEEEG
ncbi:AAA family ATPase [Caldinitratiruptor microaerophilus]|uniref:AAA+ ATPase domain-containing protein n=1 Tax=Caldinitratiruptor microaerophilus TaxID=671077 RepID=A0AA35CQY2_9FIRM|nr:AAA family ATPase [Caldinitratiruptor microaerophilus]BDG62321.1 hypothetical protein caldi_34110 [Caldinitratiruptor microaerophilus]